VLHSLLATATGYRYTPSMRSVAIAAKISSPEALDYARRLAQDLRIRGIDVVFDQATAAALSDPSESYPKSDLGHHADLLITFGGDGTLLSVARHAPSDVPIIGVNMGTLGFLTEIRVEEFPAVLERVLCGKFESERRVAFDVVVTNGIGAERVYRVLNDAVMNKSALARIVEMKVRVAGYFVSTFRADGLIVSTPTGSTAYNLSAGGPIIYPTMGAIVITPICPHMLTNRPLVLPDDLSIEIGISSEQDRKVYLTLDGQEGFPLNTYDRVCIRKSSQTIQLVLSPDKNYFDVLRNKLKWGEA
jgi:NAD+ kinase